MRHAQPPYWMCAGKVGIFSSNNVQWMLAMQAGNYYSMVVGKSQPRQTFIRCREMACLAVCVWRAVSAHMGLVGADSVVNGGSHWEQKVGQNCGRRCTITDEHTVAL